MNAAIDLSVTSLYTAILAILLILMAVRVGIFRQKNSILLGDGGNRELLRLIRGHGNFPKRCP